MFSIAQMYPEKHRKIHRSKNYTQCMPYVDPMDGNKTCINALVHTGVRRVQS